MLFEISFGVSSGAIPQKSILTLQTPAGSRNGCGPFGRCIQNEIHRWSPLYVSFRIDERTIVTLGWPGHRKGVSGPAAKLR